MNHQQQIKTILGQYPASTLFQFIETLPPPDTHQFKFYYVKSQEGHSIPIWGHNIPEVLEEFEDFIKLLIFA